MMPSYGMGMPPCDVGYGGRGGRMGGGRGGFYNGGYDGFASSYGGGDGLPLGGGGGGYGGYGQGYGGGSYSGMGPRGGSYSALGPRGAVAGRAKRPFVTMKRGSSFQSETGYTVRMRGLPYSATEDDVAQFFEPLTCVKIGIQYNKDGRASGDADVDFASYEEAQEALKKNKAMMQKRYIELFMRESKPSRSSNFGGGSGFGNGCLYGGNNYTAF